MGSNDKVVLRSIKTLVPFDHQVVLVRSSSFLFLQRTELFFKGKWRGHLNRHGGPVTLVKWEKPESWDFGNPEKKFCVLSMFGLIYRILTVYNWTRLVSNWIYYSRRTYTSSTESTNVTRIQRYYFGDSLFTVSVHGSEDYVETYFSSVVRSRRPTGLLSCFK